MDYISGVLDIFFGLVWRVLGVCERLMLRMPHEEDESRCQRVLTTQSVSDQGGYFSFRISLLAVGFVICLSQVARTGLGVG